MEGGEVDEWGGRWEFNQNQRFRLARKLPLLPITPTDPPFEREPDMAETELQRRTAAQQRGAMIGILVAVLVALAVFFYWRGTGARDARGHHPSKAAIENGAPQPKEPR